MFKPIGLETEINMNWRAKENPCGSDFGVMDTPCDSSFYSNREFLNTPHSCWNPAQNLTRESYNYEHEKKQDEEFINKFVKERGHKKSSQKKSPVLRICDAKNHLTEIMSLKQQLENEITTLNAMSDSFDKKWEIINEKKFKIGELLSVFNDESLHTLKVLLQKRMKKRIWIKKRKLMWKNDKKEMEEYIKAKHTSIDKLLGEKCKEVESIKRKEALKRQADTVLHEVKKKKYEAKKMLNMLSALMKLRELRRQQEVAQGGYCSKEVTDTFNGVINHFQDLWMKQSEIYNLEEKGLKVMLEESDIPQMKISNFQKTLNQWEEALFGTPSMDSQCRFLNQAEYDVNSLIFVRQEWDKYITSASTILSCSIPVGWVLPPETDNEEWKSYVKSRKKLCCSSSAADKQ